MYAIMQRYLLTKFFISEILELVYRKFLDMDKRQTVSLIKVLLTPHKGKYKNINITLSDRYTQVLPEKSIV